jgi:hypothetical protein
VFRGRHGPADEINQHRVGAPPADLDANRKGAIGVEFHRNRGGTDAAALRLATQDQAVALECPDDDRNGLRREPAGQARAENVGIVFITHNARHAMRSATISPC